MCENWEVKIEGSTKEKVNEKSNELSKKEGEQKGGKLILSVNKNESEGTYCFPNDLNYALFNVSSFVQVEQRAITFIFNCSMPKSIGKFKSFHGVCTLSVVTHCYRLMIHFKTGLLVAHHNEVAKGVAALQS